jgi:ketosteroid isomerase-like protein
MHPHSTLIERFYACFQQLDGDGMTHCYHENIEFSDPIFPNLRGSKVGAMWRMLCSQAREFELTVKGIQSDDTTGRVHWEAKYIFSKTGRSVHNKIDATFRFQDEKIIHHLDRFNFWKWSIMALGPVGVLFGWSPLVKNKVRKQAAENLERFISKVGK